MKTTLNQIQTRSPDPALWRKLLRNLGKSRADDEALAITTILESNGLDDALWCLRAVEEHQQTMRLFAVACARSVKLMNNDPLGLAAVDVAERYAFGRATYPEMTDARDAVYAALDAKNRAGTAGFTWDSVVCVVTEADAWDAARNVSFASALEVARFDGRTETMLTAQMDHVELLKVILQAAPCAESGRGPLPSRP